MRFAGEREAYRQEGKKWIFFLFACVLVCYTAVFSIVTQRVVGKSVA